MWYSQKILELLRKNFLPGAKYMDEPKISRYLARTEKPSARSASNVPKDTQNDKR